MSLTPAQQAAVTRLGQDVCVMAGPGSGKTRVLVERFRWLVETQGIAPARLLAITFTEKAAAELRHRLLDAFDERPELLAEVDAAPILTIDALCVRLLRENALALGVDPDFTVLDELPASLLLGEAIDSVLNGWLARDPEQLRELFRTWKTSDPRADLQLAYTGFRMSMHESVRYEQPSADGVRASIEEAVRAAEQASRAKLSAGAQAMLDAAREWLERTRSGPLFSPIAPTKRQKGPLKDAIQQAEQRLARLPYSRPRAFLAGIVAEVDAAYRAAKQLRSSFDFHDLEAEVLSLLTRSERAASAIRERYDYMLMDEVQDTNPLQWRLANLLRRPGRFFAVGDINQAIYGFRHARPEGFREYRDAVAATGAPVDLLRENFRSRSAILTFAERVTGNEPGLEPPQLTAGRQFLRDDEEAVSCYEIDEPDARERPAAEAAWVADQVVTLLTNGFRVDVRGRDQKIRCADIAILCSTTGRFRQLEAALAARRVPYLMTGGKSFFSEQEVLDGLLWLKALAQPLDEVSLAGVLRSPLVGIDPGTLWALRLANSSLAEAVSTSRMALLEECAALWRQQRDRADDVSPDQLLLEAFDWADAWSHWSPAQHANIAKLLRLLREQWLAEPGPLAQVLDRFEDQRRLAREPNAPAIQSPDAVQLMTMHAAKGLEFPVVFLPALDLRSQSDGHDLIYSPSRGLGVTWRSDVDPVCDAATEAWIEEEKERSQHEANRLLYVAITRAEQKLIVSFPRVDRASAWIRQVKAAIPPTLVTRPWPNPGPLTTADAPPPVERIPVEPPDPAICLPATVTQIQRLLDCPRRYFLDFVIGWPGSADSAGPAELDPDSVVASALTSTALGLAVHRRLAGGSPDPRQPEVEALVSAFERSALGQRCRRANRVWREEQFIAPVAGLAVRGQIDLSFEEAGQLVVVDYKTDDLAPAEVPGRARAYALQVQLYALALEQMRGRRPDAAYLHFLRPGLAVPVDIGESALVKARNAVSRFQRHREESDFPLAEGERCQRCPHRRAACPAQGTPEQMDLFGDPGRGT